MSRRLTLATIIGMALAAPANAQTYNGLAIGVEARTIHADGGERGNTGFAAGPVTVGETRSGAFAKLPEMCGFGVAARLLPGGTGGWTVSVTPLRVEDSAVTFRLEWARLAGATPSGVGGTSEITLRPGSRVESIVRFALGQVVDIQLPRLTENARGAFDGRTFWLRIRIRQLR